MLAVKDVVRDALACLIIETADAIKAGCKSEALSCLQEMSDMVMSDTAFTSVHHVIIK